MDYYNSCFAIFLFYFNVKKKLKRKERRKEREKIINEEMQGAQKSAKRIESNVDRMIGGELFSSLADFCRFLTKL